MGEKDRAEGIARQIVGWTFGSAVPFWVGVVVVLAVIFKKSEGR